MTDTSANGASGAQDSSATRWGDLPVHFLVLEMSGFIVFLDEELDVDWKTTDEYDIEHAKTWVERGAILNRVAFLQAVPIDHLPRAQRLGFRRMLGEGVARALEGDLPDAAEMLEKAEEFVTLRNGEHARLWYLSAGGIAAAVVLVLTGACWFAREAVVSRIGQTSLDFILAAAAGGLGAILSIYRRVARLPLDPSAGRRLHYVEGAAHVILGCIGAVIARLALKSGLIAPQALSASQGQGTWILVCILAGASERLVPSLVDRFELAMSRVQPASTGLPQGSTVKSKASNAATEPAE